MGGYLLFCISEAAKPFVRRALNARFVDGVTRVFYLVESSTCPDTGEGFREELQEGETFETDFIGASVQDCQNWILQNQFQHLFIEQDFIAIADARSAIDNTIVVQFYGLEFDVDEIDEPVEFEGFGVLPREPNTWVDWRIEPEVTAQVTASLLFGALDVTYPAYLGLKEELTDANGVFNVAKAERIARGEAIPDVLQG